MAYDLEDLEDIKSAYSCGFDSGFNRGILDGLEVARSILLRTKKHCTVALEVELCNRLLEEIDQKYSTFKMGSGDED